MAADDAPTDTPDTAPGPPDDTGDDDAMGAVGNVARAPKGADTSNGAMTLSEFSVKKGDNGGCTVCETYERKPPPGRRSGAGFPISGDYKENPFSPGDGVKASTYIGSLLAKMGVMTPDTATAMRAGPGGPGGPGPVAPGPGGPGGGPAMPPPAPVRPMPPAGPPMGPPMGGPPRPPFR